MEAAPEVNPVALFDTGTPLAFATGRLRMSSSALRSPRLLIKSRLMFKTGFGPTSSAVGMLEPVTMTRSASAWTPVCGAVEAPPATGAAALVVVGLVAPGFASGSCANAHTAVRRKIPAAAATHRGGKWGSSLVILFFVICFSVRLVKRTLRFCLASPRIYGCTNRIP